MHKTKEAALKAARADLGDDAIEGVDFKLVNSGAGWTHESIALIAPKPKSAPKPKTASKAKAAAKAPKAVPAPKAKAVKAAAPKSQPAEGQTKTQVIEGMLKRPGGATSKEMEEATGWQPHSVRGLLGTMRAKGVKVISKKHPKEPTVYSIAKAAADDVGAVV